MLGKLLQGRYQVVQILSVGEFCQTYLAEDTACDRHFTCVIKHLKPASNDPDSLETLRQSFNREAQALEKLGNYDQVPQLLAHFEEDKEFYLVQEFIAGHPLSVEILPGQPWSESQVIQLLQEVLGILEFVHSHGLIHRDIKPTNLIRRQLDGRLVLIDFGSVKQAWMQVVTAQGKTSASFAFGIPATIAIGTPGYMPTEQERGRPRLNSDIYALGIIGIQALTGLSPRQLLEDVDTGETIWQHQVQVSALLASVLSKMVRYHFKDRYQSATEVLQALQPLKRALEQESRGNSGARLRRAEPSAELAWSPLEMRGKEGRGEFLSQGPTGAQSPTEGNPLLRSSERRFPHLGLRAPAGLSHRANPKVEATGVGRRPEGSPVGMKGRGEAEREVPALDTSYNKNALLIGVATGVASALALIFVIYYALQPPAPAVKDQQYPASILSENTTIGNITLANTLIGHSDGVWFVALGPNGQTLVSSSGDKTIKLWNLRTGELRRTLSGHSGQVLSVALSPNGQLLASSSWDQTIKLWNLRTGELRRTLNGDSNEVWSLTISPDGQTLVSSSRNINKIWNLRTGELLRNLSGHSDTVWSVAISPDGQTLVSGSKDQTIKLWNLRTGELRRTLVGHSGRVRSIAVSPDSQLIASGSWDQTIKIWNLRTGELLRTLSGHSAYVNCVAISPQGNVLASGSDDYTIKLWNLRTGELLRTISGHSSNVNSVTFDATGKTLVSSSEDKTIKIWRL